MAEVKNGCKLYKSLGSCPLDGYIVAGNMLPSGAYWCGDYAQQATCGNTVHEMKAKPISHRAAHSRNFHQVDMPRSTSTGSIETAQSAEQLLVFEETQETRRIILAKNGVDL